MILLVDLERAGAQNTTDKVLLKRVKTALALQRTESQQCNSNYDKDREKWVTDNVVIDAKFRKNRSHMNTAPGRLQHLLDDETRRTNQMEEERKRIFLSEKSPAAR